MPLRLGAELDRQIRCSKIYRWRSTFPPKNFALVIVVHLVIRCAVTREEHFTHMV